MKNGGNYSSHPLFLCYTICNLDTLKRDRNEREKEIFLMTYAFMIEPDFYTPLHTDEERIEKCQEWGLLSDKATKLKTFYYKGNGLNVPCTIVGFVDHMAAVIQLDNDQKHCIHPAYLKEMQASGFKGTLAAAPDKKAGTCRRGGRQRDKLRRILIR